MELRPFQQRELAKYAHRKKVGIAWDMGLGKTAGSSTKAALEKKRRWLVLCPDNAFSVWRDQARPWIEKAWPRCTVRVEFIDGSPWNRDLQWSTPYDTGAECVHIRVCTLDTFLRDWRVATKTGLKGKRSQTVRFMPRPYYNVPEVVIIDEARRFRNKDTQLFKVLSAWCTHYSPDMVIPMTGTPGHEPKHFWTMLHLIDRVKFRSYWKFVEAFHQIDEGIFGMEVNEPKNLDIWHQVLANHFSVVKEEEVANERPPLTRQLLEITMDEDQTRLYNDIKDEMMSFVEADSSLILAQNEFTVATRFRQILVCPRILSPSLSVGNAIKDFAETEEPGHNVVIFTPFTDAHEHFETFLKGKGFEHIYLFYGGMGTPERDARLALYRDNKGVAICSILYAQAFSFEPATRAYFIGYDWDPDNNRQAEKRLHRLTTQNPITCYYYTYRSTFDERLCNIVNLKQQRVNMTIPSQLKEVLHASSSPHGS